MSIRSMLHLGSLCLSLLGFLGSSTVFADAALQRWHADIGQGYQALATSSADLARAAQDYCKAPQPEAKAALETSRRAAFMDWQRVRFIDFGPIEQNSLAWQFQFWPDTKNLVGKKTRTWLSGDRTPDRAAVKADSVAVQGFPALEYLLFDEQPSKLEKALPHPQACSLLVAIAQHIAGNAQQLSNDWSRFGQHYVGEPRYAEDTVLAAMHGLEQMKGRRLAAPMGADGKGRRNPYLADAWRSGQSLAAIHASLEGLQALFLPGLQARLENEQQAQLYDQFARQLDSTLERFADMPSSLKSSLTDESDYRQLQLLLISVERLNTILSEQIAPELGVVKGFNSSDGD